MSRNFPWLRIVCSIFVMVLAGAHVSWADENDGVEAFLKSHPNYQGYVTPMPPYSPSLSDRRTGGMLVLKIFFAAKGDVTDIEVVKSTGSHWLEESTVQYVKRHWKRTVGKPTVKIQTFAFGDGRR